MLGKRIAIDIGSSRTRVFDAKRGLIYSQPTLLARDVETGQLVAVGEEALEMSGRLPEGIDIVHPLHSGVIADYQAATALLKDVLRQTSSRVRLTKPESIITVSASATSTERKALIDAASESGFQNVYLLKSALAAAIGAELPIEQPQGNIIMDIGAGTTEIGVFSLGGTVAERSLRVGSNAIDDAINHYIRREHGMIVGREELKRIKHEFAAISREAGKTLHIHGQDIVQGMPKTSTINLRQMQSYLMIPLERIEGALRKVLEQTPPDLLSDTIKHGVVMSGGGSLLPGLDSHFEKRFKVAFIRPDKPKLVAVRGAQAASQSVDEFKRSLIT